MKKICSLDVISFYEGNAHNFISLLINFIITEGKTISQIVYNSHKSDIRVILK